MSLSLHRLARLKAGKVQLQSLVDTSKSVIAIHYSCESFYDRTDGTSPRITSIAVRNIHNGQTTSFSIHQMAEREKKFTRAEIEANYDRLEKKMLKEFYEYVERHANSVWIHWNMRDINYGFPALAHRLRVLGGAPVEIHESNLCDLARLLVDLYGVGYIDHPRLQKLVEKNNISHKDFLPGQEEAQAFENGEYVKLHQSTLRKVDILANILERIANGSLKTNAKFHEIYGGYFAAVVHFIREHWIVALIAFISGIIGIIGPLIGN